MLSISNTAGSPDYGETSFDNPYTSDADEVRAAERLVIDKANLIPITALLNSLSIRIDPYNSKIRCIFHLGGNEKTSSLNFYLETNSFHCFGCKVSGRPVDFISRVRKISRIESAHYILANFANLSNIDYEIPVTKCCLVSDATVSFANEIRQFMHNNPSPEGVAFAEKITFSFDKINEKHSLSQEGLTSLINKLRKKLELY